MQCLLVPCSIYAYDENTKPAGRFIISFEGGTTGNYYHYAQQALKKEKPEAKNFAKTEEGTVGLRIDFQFPFDNLNAAWGIAADISAGPSYEFEGKKYYWSSFTTQMSPDSVVFYRLMYTADYFIIGSSFKGSGIALSGGIGISGADMPLDDDEYGDEYHFSGLTYEYGVSFYIMSSEGLGVYLSAKQACLVKSSDINWKNEMFALGAQIRF